MWDSPSKVEWSKFKAGLKGYLQMTNDSDPVWEDIKIKLLTGGTGDHDNAVTLSAFEKILYWFGPLKGEDGETILTRIPRFYKTNGFHFLVVLPSATAVQMLSKESPGAFIDRLNEGGSCPIREAPWTLSVRGNKGVNHHRIIIDNGVISVKNDSFQVKKPSKNLFDLVAQLQTQYPNDFSSPQPPPQRGGILY